MRLWLSTTGFGKNFVQFVYDFHGFEKVDEESKETFSNLVTLSKELELDLQEDDFIDLLAVQYEVLTNEDLMELEAQRKDEERQEEEEVTEEPKRFMMQEMARGCSLFVEALLVFEAQDLNTMRRWKQLFRMQSSAMVSPMTKKKSYRPDITGSFFQEGRCN